jgi:hypothetical protein
MRRVTFQTFISRFYYSWQAYALGSVRNQMRRIFIYLLVAFVTFLIGLLAQQLGSPTVRAMMIKSDGKRTCLNVRMCAKLWGN